jgi:Uma2 family endonuclease
MTRIARPLPLAEQQHIVLHDVSWKLYERLLKDIGDRPVRVTFYRGSIEIMSPLPKHERVKRWIGRMVDTMCLELAIPVETLGSTTFRLKPKSAGLEPDDCFYVQHADAVRGKERLDLSVDPPPDLAVEVDITRRSIKRQPVYAALGVPELWRWNGKKLSVLALREGRYREVDGSDAFPFLPVKQLEPYLHRLLDGDNDLAVMQDFQKWVRTLKP